MKVIRGDGKELYPDPALPSRTTDEDVSWDLYAKRASFIKANPPPEATWDVEKFIEGESGPVMWFGDSGSFKSFLALHVAMCVATGVPVFEHFRITQRKEVYYINIDAGANSFERRAIKLERHPDNLFILSVDEWNPTAFGQLLADHRGGFFVIDCWADVFEPDPAMDQARDMREALKEVRRAFELHGCNGIIIDHSKRKPSGAAISPADSYYGSNQKKATLRQMTHIGEVKRTDGNRNEARVKLTCVKMSEAEKFDSFLVDITFAEDTFTCRYAGDASAQDERESKAERKVDEIVSALQSLHPASASAAEVATAVEMHREDGTFKRAMREARDAGKIESIGSGRAVRYFYRSERPDAGPNGAIP